MFLYFGPHLPPLSMWTNMRALAHVATSLSLLYTNLRVILPTLVIHFPGLWLRGRCSRTGAPVPPTRCSIDLFVQCVSPTTTSSSSFLYFLLPFLPLSVSVSSSASLPYVTQKGPQHTDEGESGLWADRPERKQALRCTAIGAQHCQHMKLRINPKQTFGCSHSRNVTCMQRWMWHPKTIHLVNLLKSPKVSCTHRLLKAFLLFKHLSERLQDLQTQFILFVHQLLGVFD